MKILSLVLVLFSSHFMSAQAAFYPTEIKNAKFNLGPQAAVISWEKLLFNFPEFSLDYIAKEQVFPRDGQMLTWESSEFKLRFLMSALFPLPQTLSLPSLEILSGASDLEATVGQASWTDSKGNKGELKDFKLTGKDARAFRFSQTNENMIDGLLANTTSTLVAMDMPTTQKFVTESGESIVISRIENADIAIKDGAIHLTAKIIGPIKMGLEIAAVATIDGTQGTLTIRVDKAKAGIINIREIMLDGIKKMNNPKIEVISPNIKIKL